MFGYELKERDKDDQGKSYNLLSKWIYFSKWEGDTNEKLEYMITLKLRPRFLAW